MANNLYYPKVGAGLRDLFEPGTTSKLHGRVLNAPVYAGLGGLSGKGAKGINGESLKIRKPGGEK